MPKGLQACAQNVGGRLSPNGYRRMKCLKCGLEEDRDIVAVKNLLRRCKIDVGASPVHPESPPMTPLEPSIDFYLFQLPPSMTPRSLQTLENFITKTDLGNRFALEVRNMKWFDKAYIQWASKLNTTWVSVDSPDFPLDIYNTNGIVYERMHGRTAWYSHYYTDQELKDVANRIRKANPEKVYVFFNNNHAMLENARRMLQILSA